MSGWPRRGWRREVPEPAASWGRRPCHRPRGQRRGRGLERRIGECSGEPARPGALDGEAPPGERAVQGRCDDDRAARLDPRASPTRARANGARRQLWPPRSGRCRSAARPRARRPTARDPGRDGSRSPRRPPGPTRAEVVPEARQLRGGDPGIGDQRAGRAVDDDRQVPERLAPVDEDPVPRPASARDPYPRVLEPSLTSSSSSWSNASGPQPVASDAIAASSASFDG